MQDFKFKFQIQIIMSMFSNQAFELQRSSSSKELRPFKIWYTYSKGVYFKDIRYSKSKIIPCQSPSNVVPSVVDYVNNNLPSPVVFHTHLERSTLVFLDLPLSIAHKSIDDLLSITIAFNDFLDVVGKLELYNIRNGYKRLYYSTDIKDLYFNHHTLLFEDDWVGFFVRMGYTLSDSKYYAARLVKYDKIDNALSVLDSDFIQGSWVFDFKTRTWGGAGLQPDQLRINKKQLTNYLKSTYLG